MVDEAGRGGASGVVKDEEGPVGTALSDRGIGVVVDREQHEAAGGEAERVGDGGDRGRVREVGKEVGDGGREQEEVVILEAGGEVCEVEGDDAVVDEARPVKDCKVGADEHHVTVAQHPLLSLLGVGTRAHSRRRHRCLLLVLEARTAVACAFAN